MAALVLGSEVGLVVAGMRADFARYLLPVLMANAVCGGIAVGALWQALWSRLGRRIEAPAPAPAGATLAREPATS